MLKLHFPHPLALLVGCILVAAALSYILPAGQYERRDDPETGRKVVVAGTYSAVASSPVGPFEAFVAIPRGMADAGSVIFLVFLIGGSFTVVDRTGTLARAVDWLVRRLRHREALVIPTISVAFALGGALENMREEVIALVPVLLVLTRRLGFEAITAVSMSIGAAAVGAAFSPINPFQVGIAQKLAEIPMLSGSLFRLGFLVPALVIWIWGTMRYAARTRTVQCREDQDQSGSLGLRHGLILMLLVVTFMVLAFGVLRLAWHFEQMSALFFVMGASAGLIGRLHLAGTAEAFVEGFKSMAYAGLLIGFARAIYIVLDQGRIVDTIVHALFAPIALLPAHLSALGMMVVQTAVHFPVPSVSGHAVLTLPVLVPLSDLLGLPRQVTVLAYQYGAGLCELLTPTNGALMAILATAGVRYEQWLKFALPLYLALSILGMIAIYLGISIKLK
ncbi:MAG TPA: Na+/H+ antiporter NhaC family protein [Candidatus Binatia bacterium]|jgi:uncharacterized ion transporter superfamily protein YfcC|nr:Na+/H+ antiporter NhaC family protein [Candidatus Binatia bacterium]